MGHVGDLCSKKNKILLQADFSTALYDCLLQIMEDIFVKLNGCKCSFKIHFTEANLEIAVDEECEKYFT